MKPTFVLPESFDPREFLKTTQLARRFDDARYFVSTIMRKMAAGDVDKVSKNTAVVRLRAEHLKNVMYQTDYSAVIDALLEGEAVARSPYQVGKEPFGYYLLPRFAEDKHVRHEATDKRLIRRLTKVHKDPNRASDARFLPVHYRLENLQRHLEIDGNKARETLAGLPPRSNRFDSQGILIRDIEERDYRLSVGQYGRVANNITSLKREVRKSLHVSGKNLVSVDLSCAQPAFIAQKAGQRYSTRDDQDQGKKQEGKQEEEQGDQTENVCEINYDSSCAAVPEDSHLYRRLVQSGELYEFLSAALGHRFTRQQLKKKVLADVIAKRKASSWGGEYQSDVEDKFRELFPSVYLVIRQINRDGREHANLIRELQQQESSLVIETVCDDLTSQFPDVFFITLHDAIYTTSEHIPKVTRAFQQAFERTGFLMMLKIED